jgi:tRNA threonylcarbamoyladenosine biosynthesis protein TsaB
MSVLRDDDVLQSIAHEGTSDYSSWLLPTAEKALRACGLRMTDIDVFAAAAGPGSFTGVRVGLTTVKAWSEAYGKSIAGVSRLEAMASQVAGGHKHVAAFVDAQRGQVFGGLYSREATGLKLLDQEMVIEPEGFLNWVSEQTGRNVVSWISMDPKKITALDRWGERAKAGECVQASATVLAPTIGRVGRQRALVGRLIDALSLDAEYVRRSDAEIFWKEGARRGS